MGSDVLCLHAVRQATQLAGRQIRLRAEPDRAENVRAQKVYARAGFVEEARLRNHDFVPVLDRTIDTLLYGILRSEWEALEPLARRA